VIAAGIKTEIREFIKMSFAEVRVFIETREKEYMK
jgi:hypothetical protein